MLYIQQQNWEYRPFRGNDSGNEKKSMIGFHEKATKKLNCKGEFGQSTTRLFSAAMLITFNI